MKRNQYINKQLERMRTTMTVRGLSPLTVHRYSQCAREFLQRSEKPLGTVSGKDIEDYLAELVASERDPVTRLFSVEKIGANVHLAAAAHYLHLSTAQLSKVPSPLDLCPTGRHGD